MTRAITYSLRVLLTLFSLLQAAPALSNESIKIGNASSRFENDQYLLDANIQYELSDNSREALEHGVTLNFLVIADLYQQRKWLWNKHVRRATLLYQLDYHPLSQRYLVSNQAAGKREDFHSLEAALRYLGTITNQVIFKTENIRSSENHFLQLKAKLDIQSLPGPLQPLTLFSPDWNLISRTLRFPIQPS